MKTKAELEAEINDLKFRVAELEGAVAAYRFAFEHVGQPAPSFVPQWNDNWNGGALWPPTFPIVTWNNTSE